LAESNGAHSTTVGQKGGELASWRVAKWRFFEVLNNRKTRNDSDGAKAQ
jgi:hypothetical protein